jgi:SAM-dependent methyltransferase
METLKRFSNRVDDYVKYRPGYPPGVLALMKDRLGLKPEHKIADLGSGTGIFSQILLSNGNHVFGIEPNREMRERGEDLLKKFPNFKSVNGTAEQTTLLDHSIDFVTSAQAFHWFDPLRTRWECLRILKKGGTALFVWNERKPDSSPFLKDYENLLQTLAVDYLDVSRLDSEQEEAMKIFFGGPHAKAAFENHQDFDFTGLRGRLMSSSYAPKENHPNHEPCMRRLREIFDRHQKNGRVRFEYETGVYYGKPTSDSVAQNQNPV